VEKGGEGKKKKKKNHEGPLKLRSYQGVSTGEETNGIPEKGRKKDGAYLAKDAQAGKSGGEDA